MTITIGGTSIPPGQSRTIDLEAGRLYTREPVYMPTHVVNGKQDGPVLFVCAAIHGDELNGIEIARRLMTNQSLKRLTGALIVVPVVNVLGVVHRSRYLPDRRDLNRSFPGSPTGSLAARHAHLFMREVVSHATHGVDLHTGAIHRNNLPQIRADLSDPETARLAKAFGSPLVLRSEIREGSLREAASELGVRVLVYEAGEALRFDETAIRLGVRGVQNIMRALGMIKSTSGEKPTPYVARYSFWARAPATGIFHSYVQLGERVSRKQLLGAIADPFGDEKHEVRSRRKGILIGKSNLPLVHEGEAIFHIGCLSKPSAKDSADDSNASTTL